MPIALIGAAGSGSARFAWLAKRALDIDFELGSVLAKDAFPDAVTELRDQRQPFDSIERLMARYAPETPQKTMQSELGILGVDFDRNWTTWSQCCPGLFAVIIYNDPGRACVYHASHDGVEPEAAVTDWLEFYARALSAVPPEDRILVSMNQLAVGDWTSLEIIRDRLRQPGAAEVWNALREFFVGLCNAEDGQATSDVPDDAAIANDLKAGWMLLDAARVTPENASGAATRLGEIVKYRNDARHASELDAIKSSRWWRLRHCRTPLPDLTSEMAPAFQQFIDDGLLFGLRPSRASLCLGRNLAELEFEEYRLVLAVPVTIDAISVSFAADVPGTTFAAGIELVSASGQIVMQRQAEAVGDADLGASLKLRFDPVALGAGISWGFRLFVRGASGPVRAYEYQRRHTFRRWRIARYVFCALHATSPGR